MSIIILHCYVYLEGKKQTNIYPIIGKILSQDSIGSYCNENKLNFFIVMSIDKLISDDTDDIKSTSYSLILSSSVKKQVIKPTTL